jgi:hypothetical protein
VGHRCVGAEEASQPLLAAMPADHARLHRRVVGDALGEHSRDVVHALRGACRAEFKPVTDAIFHRAYARVVDALFRPIEALRRPLIPNVDIG